MSPGATFERVYNELKHMLADGTLPPGSPIEPARIGAQIAASITPIRDALHRLTGERLVEAPNHNGFRVPLPTEAALRDLYRWNGSVLALAARQFSPGSGRAAVAQPHAIAETAMSAPAFFLAIARGTGSVELTIAVSGLNDRLATFRRAEVTALESVTEELTGLAGVAASGDRTALAGALVRYHRRRIARVGSILAHFTLPD
jgi:DNA-binding GntR family transcriptional regulator